MQTLRPYQRDCVQAVTDALFWDNLNRVLYTQPTGCGKTTTFAELTREFLAEDKKVLILAHRTELIGQAYNRVMEHCNLHEWDIGMEIAQDKAHRLQRVIVGSVQTCYRPNRLPQGWEPQVIIVDESHHSAASTYRKIAERFGVPEGRCAYIGCTATAKRTDKLSLYAVDIHGKPVMLERKGRKPEPADPDESVFQKHVYDFTVLDAIEGGWLVPIRGHAVETETDLNGLKTRMGDFEERELAKRVDNMKRTMEAISAWKKIAADRPTLVFCASVEHAHHAADLWRQAGYTADAVDGETDSTKRHQLFHAFKTGALQVLCNMQVATEGTDLPNCSCIVHLRPTKSWNLYLQTSGRCTRTWPGVLDPLQEADAEERKAAIAASLKPDSIIIDLVDLYEKCGDLCSVPSILDLPVKLNLQGASVSDAKKLLDEFEEVRERVIGECPATYEELEVRLRHVNLMRHSGADTVSKWRATDDGYRFVGIPPGYQCDMNRDGDGFRLSLRWNGQTILTRSGKPGRDMNEYLDAAAGHAQRAIAEHKASLPAVARGTLDRLTYKQINCLKANGHSDRDIDGMTYYKAKALIRDYVARWRARV